MSVELELYDDSTSWKYKQRGGFYCSSCGYVNGGYYFSSDGYHKECSSCSFNSMQEIVHDKLESGLTARDISRMLSPDAHLPGKLGLMLCLKLVMETLKEYPLEDREDAYRGIAACLGDTRGHLLSIPLMVHTHIQLYLFGEDMKPFILEAAEKCTIPGFLMVNTALLLGYIAWKDDRVQEIISETVGCYPLLAEKLDYSNDTYRPLMHPKYLHDELTKFIMEVELLQQGRDAKWIEHHRAKSIVRSSLSGHQLKRFYEGFLKKLCLESNLINKAKAQRKSLLDDEYARLSAQVLTDRVLALQMVKKMSPAVRHAFRDMVWARIPAGPGEMNLTVKNFRWGFYGDFDSSLPAEIACMKYEHQYPTSLETDNVKFYLPEGIAVLARKVLPLPPESTLMETPFQEGLILSRNDSVCTELSYLKAMIGQVGIKRSKNGKKILKSVLNQARKMCGIDEPYKAVKGLDVLRTEMLIELVSTAELLHQNLADSGMQLLKETANCCFSPMVYGSFDAVHLLDYLKVDYYDPFPCSDEIRLAVFAVLKNLPEDGWINFDQVNRFIIAQGYRTDPVDLEHSMNGISFSADNDSRFYPAAKRRDLKLINFQDALIIPYIKMLLFALNSLGLVELGLDPAPANPRFQGKNPWLSAYDGVRQIRLTDLGAWVAGRKDSSDIKEEESQGRVVLDQKRLLVTIYGNNPMAELLFPRIAVPAGNNRFLVSEGSFLGSCANKEDVEQFIEQISSLVQGSVPKVWKEFFSALQNQIDPLDHLAGQYIVFKVNPDQKDLIDLLFHDPVLSSLVMKAEGYHICVEERKYENLKRRLKTFGYLLPDKL